MNFTLDKFGGCKMLRTTASGFFRVAHMQNRWWFVTPEGNAFFSLGVNHIDSGALHYPDNFHIYQQRYHGDEAIWLREGVVKPLQEWGFNTLGWVQEACVAHRRHSHPWRPFQYRWAGMPYCHLLPFTEFEYWNKQAILPDVFSGDFEDWCDWIARDFCVEARDDPYLLGYFYADIPCWGRHPLLPLWQKILDPESSGGQRRMGEFAARYYRVLHDAVRRYDRHHLILGDRYNGDTGIPDPVLLAARDSIDVLSVQYFAPWRRQRDDFQRWHQRIRKPCINADCAYTCPPTFDMQLPGVTFDPHGPHGKFSSRDQRERGQRYAQNIGAALREPYMIGWHWCAFLQNRFRAHGLKDTFDEPFDDCVRQIQVLNRQCYRLAGIPVETHEGA